MNKRFFGITRANGGKSIKRSVPRIDLCVAGQEGGELRLPLPSLRRPGGWPPGAVLPHPDETAQPVDDRLLVHPLLDQDETAHVGRQLGTALGGFLRGQLLVAVIVGVMSSVGFWLIDLPFWLLIGLIAGTYSSVFVASPILLMLRNRALERRAKEATA